jgi:hypothetical protein
VGESVREVVDKVEIEWLADRVARFDDRVAEVEALRSITPGSC